VRYDTLLSTKTPLVSIVIPTKNSAKTLPELLQSIACQNLTNLETIVVDDFSTDDTGGIAKAFRVQFYSVEGSRTQARNYGLKIAQGVYVFFVDSDMILQTGLVEECVKLCLDGGHQAIIVPEVDVGRGYWVSCLRLGKEISRVERGHEAARFFDRTLAEYLGGYDEKLLAGEDFDLHRRAQKLGLRFASSESEIYHQVGDLSFFELMNKYRFYGKSIDTYRDKWKSEIHSSPDEFVRLVFRKRHLLLGNLIEAPGYFLIVLAQYVIQRH